MNSYMAEQKSLHLTIAKIDEPVFDGEVVSVTVPGVEGEMTILAQHEALISPLKEGVVTIKTTKGAETHNIESGTLEISNNRATILI